MRLVRTRRLQIAVCVFQSLMLLAPLSALAAAGDGGDLARVAKFEQAALSTTHPDWPLEKRLRTLEDKLFGHEESGPITARLDKIARAAQLHHPAFSRLTPKLDKSEDVQTAAPSPMNSQMPEPAPSAAPQASDRVTSLLVQAMQKHNQGDVTQAESLFRQVIKIDPHNSDAYYNLGAISEEKGSLDEALKDYNVALKINPQDTDLQQAVSSVEGKLQERKTAQANAQQQAREQQHQVELKRLANEGAAAYRSKNFDLAIADLEKVAAQVPNDPDVQFGLAQAYRGKGNVFAAKYHLARAITLDSSNPSYQKALAEVSSPGAAQNAPASAANSGMPPVAPSRYQSAEPNQMADAPQDNQPAGEITPFAPSNDSPRHYGYASSSGGYGGSFMPMGAGLLSGGFAGGGNNRMQRAVMGSVMGAVTGALMGGVTRSGVKRGAMSGAMFGGMGGLLFGGH